MSHRFKTKFLLPQKLFHPSLYVRSKNHFTKFQISISFSSVVLVLSQVFLVFLHSGINHVDARRFMFRRSNNDSFETIPKISHLENSSSYPSTNQVSIQLNKSILANSTSSAFNGEVSQTSTQLSLESSLMPDSGSENKYLHTENFDNSTSNPDVYVSLTLNVTPSTSIANCTDVEFTCTILNNQTASSKVNNNEELDQPLIWWTFKKNNVSISTLPRGRVTRSHINETQSTLSVLNIECAQFSLHNGDYQCHMQPQANQLNTNDSPIVDLDIFVPLSIVSLEPANGTVREPVDTKVQLKCNVLAHPKPKISWHRIDLSTLTVIDLADVADGRIYEESLPDSRHQFNNQLLSSVESTLIFNNLKRSDNGSYICKAQSAIKSEKALLYNFHVIVLEAPVIHIEKLEIENKASVIITFALDYEGNLEIEKYQLEIQNYSVPNSSWINPQVPWVPVGNLPNKNYSNIRLDNLMPGASYGFRLAASNQAGQSEWSYMNISVPPDVPSPINNIHLLSKSNISLLFGWRRPFHDNGAPILQYLMILRDSMNLTISNQTLDIAHSNTVQNRNNIMYVFPNLKPGTVYSFQVRACSQIGCSEWSSPLEAFTSDGIADPPLNVRLECGFDLRSRQPNATVFWESPQEPRGLILGYNISLEGDSTYKNSQNRVVLDSFRQYYQVMQNSTFHYQLFLKPNSNFTIRLCAINRSGWGQLSHITSSSMCQTGPSIPSEFPPVNLQLLTEPLLPLIDTQQKEVAIKPFYSKGKQLKISLSRVSERNGSIRCYRIVMIRLPGHYSDSSFNNSDEKDLALKKLFANGPDDVVISTYKVVHDPSKINLVGAYIAEEFASEDFHGDIIIGDNRAERCYDDAFEYNLKSRVRQGSPSSTEDSRSPRRISHTFIAKENYQNESQNDFNKLLVEDGELFPETFYTSLLEVTVMGWNNTLLIARSPFSDLIQTEKTHLTEPQHGYIFTESTQGIFFGTVSGLIIVFLLLFSVFCFLKRKTSETTPVILKDQPIGLTSFIRRAFKGHRKNSLFYQIDFNSTTSIQKWASKPIPLPSLVAVFQQRRSNSDFLFQAEFEALPESFPDRTTIHSDVPENIKKNRYPDIKSYDQTRVTLSKIDGIQGSDYINADFVNGYKNEKLFICAQGPIQETVKEFWRMVFEQQCCIIVMLTGIEEQGRIKCAQYWKDDETIELDPHFKVTTVCRRDYSDYVIRRFSLENTFTGDVRDILHFHFVAWKDFLAPEQPSWLLRFIKRVNEHYCPNRGPILVHCSAGVGRTGTFIAIDTLIAQIDDGSQAINIFQCVSKLRYQRNFLVQSLKQYIFVYRAIMEYAEFGDTEIDIAHLSDHYNQLKEHKTQDQDNGVFLEFEKLNEVFEESKNCVVGSLEANKHKNRYSFIIPYDINRVILNPSQDTCYINASFIQGYDHTLSFIVAQDPMEHTVNEFWWMITEHAVSTLVMLAELGGGQSKCHCYWSTDEFDCDYVKVKLIEEEMFQFYIKRVFHVIKKKTEKSHVVNQYQFLAWKSGVVVPESNISLIKLTDVVLANNDRIASSLSSSPPILVHCSGGGDRSSVFVSFASLVKQLRLEERVDVFQTARYTKSQRHCMLQTIAQYDFLYRCLIDYVEFHQICNKGDTQL